MPKLASLLLREKPLEGVPQGYSLATGWSARLADAAMALPERLLLRPWYGKIPIDRPIFVVGPFRSGTSITEKIISEHPDVGYFSYLSNVFYRAPITGYLFTRLLEKLTLLQKESFRPVHNPRILTSRLSPYECEWIWSQSRKSLWDMDCADVTAGADFSDPAFERYLKSNIRRHLLIQGATRFLNKNPVNCLRLGYLRKLFPDARIVSIARHPLETIVSHYRTMRRLEGVFYADPRSQRILKERLHMDMLSMSIKTTSYARTVALYREHPLLGLANQWKDLMQAVADYGARAKSKHFLQLHYEDLVSSSTAVLKKLWDFLELGGAPAERITAAYAADLTAPPPAKLTQEEAELLPRIQEIVAPIAARLGYSTNAWPGRERTGDD